VGDKTNIEWTDATWQATHGCSVVSPGCTHCYAMKMAARLEAMGQAAYAGLTQQTKGGAVWNGTVRAASDHAMTQPLRWKRPRRIFVDSMADLFAEGVEDAWIDRAFAVMALCPQHTFMVLTKRPERMRRYFTSIHEGAEVTEFAPARLEAPACDLSRSPCAAGFIEDQAWPLPNVWLGTSVEDQRRADERIPHLLATPAAVRFLSCEPLLGPLDLTHIDLPGGHSEMLPLTGYVPAPGDVGDDDCPAIGHPRIDWVIVGGESGPNAKPMHPDWARSIRDQCVVVGVPFFFKQHGQWTVTYDRDVDDPDWRRPPRDDQHPNGRYLNLAGGMGFHGDRVLYVKRVSKKAAGRTLDGREWLEMPS
jgi:protein gp37